MAIDDAALKKQFDAMRPATVAQQAQVLKGKGPGGSDLVGWKNAAGQMISGNQPGNSSYGIPVWSTTAPIESHGGEGGGDGSSGGNDDYKKIDLYSPIRQAILRDLRMPKFDANDLDKRLNQSIEGVRLEAMGNRRSIAENMFGSGSYGVSGKAADKFKEVGIAENQDINTKIQQLIQDERDYVQKQYDRGLGAATSLFNSTLNAQTAQNIAEANRRFQADLLAQQTAFAAEQAGLDRALQKYAIDQSVSNAGKGSGGQVLSGIVSGLSSGGFSIPTGSGGSSSSIPKALPGSIPSVR